MIKQEAPFSIQRTLQCLLIMLLCCLLAYWPLSFHVFSLKNDALNYFLPVRHQVSEAISNGYWPFWSPYFNLGYPLHGDMQSGVWNPFVQIISLFGPYTLKTLQYETLFYVYLSGLGMFFLIKYFFKDWRICLMCGTAFMLCGFNSDSSQYLNWISGASFLPFVFLFYYRAIIEKNGRAALWCGLFLWLLFTTAYPADFVLTVYLLAFVLIWHLFQKQNRTRKNLVSLLWLDLEIALSFLLLALPAIISYLQYLPLTQRGNGAGFEDAMSNSLHPGLLISYLTPLATWKASFAEATDPLERNSFFGLITFTLALLSFFYRGQKGLPRFFKWVFLISIIFSFGKWGGLRVISYYVLPLMNTFRHPANAKLFSIFSGCILAGYSLQQLILQPVKVSSRRICWYIIMVCFSGLLIWALSGRISIFSPRSFRSVSEVKNYLDGLGFSDLLIVELIVAIPFLLALYFFFVKNFRIKWLLVFAILNSVIHTMLFLPFTVVKKDRVSDIEKKLTENQQKGYPLPDLNASLLANSEKGMMCFDEIGTANMYNKKIGRVDYRISPSNLLMQNEFWFNDKLRNILMEYPLFYRADTAVSISDTSRLTPGKNIVIVPDSEALDFVNSSGRGNYSAVVRKFNPLEWVIQVKADRPGFYCLFQNDYPRWQVFIDGAKQDIERVNVSFMGFPLDKGDHVISLRYRTSDLKVAFLISLGMLLFIVGYSIYGKDSRNPVKTRVV